MQRLALLLIGLLLIVSGCAAPSAPATAAPPKPASLSGTVVDVELRPVEGATIILEPLALSTTTDGSGHFGFDGLTPTNVTIRIEHPDFEPVSSLLKLQPSIESRVEFRLVPLPRPTAHDETFHFPGTFDCASEVLIIGADCFVMYENVTGQKDPITDEKNAFRMLVNPGWETIFLNMTWDSGAENQLDGMRLYLEHGNGSTTGHAYQVALVAGTEQPLEIFVERGVPHPSADFYDGTETPAQISDDGEELQIRVFPRGKGNEVFGQICQNPRSCFLGVGIGLDIRFDVRAVVHYPQ